MMSEKQKFIEVCDGYGFEEVPQKAEGTYCTGCLVAHKRPTKMYSNGKGGDVMCKHAVLRFYWEDELGSDK